MTKGTGTMNVMMGDQAAGLVWRARDANNYYVARANALENNVTIYHTIKGRRTEKKRVSMKVPANQWHTLRVDVQGNHFTSQGGGTSFNRTGGSNFSNG